MKNQKLYNEIESIKARSAWDRGVKRYALELVADAEIELTRENYKSTLLNGAQDWSQYSHGGCSLIFSTGIANRLCTPSELKRKKGGELNPNKNETWLDCQARALYQACELVRRNIK